MGLIGGGGYPVYVFVQATAPTALYLGQLWVDTTTGTLYQADAGLNWVAIIPITSPIGAIHAWLKTYTNTPALPAGWVECNGQVLSDAGSVYNGQTIPNLNGSGATTQRFLRGSTTSGTTGGSDTSASLAHNHSISGSGGNIDTGSQVLSNSLSTISILPSYYEVVWIMRVK